MRFDMPNHSIKVSALRITYKALTTSVPPYFDELLQCQETTRSTDSLCLFVPKRALRDRRIANVQTSMWLFITSGTHCRTTSVTSKILLSLYFSQ